MTDASGSPPAPERVDGGEPEASARAEASARRAVEAVWRIESARIVATLTRAVGDFALAEDLAQDALADALAQWPQAGVPKNPGAWLTAVAKRKAIDGWRRRERYDERLAEIAHDLSQQTPDASAADPWDPDRIDDEVLRLVFVACHPVLSREARVALTLRVVGGLTTEEIARLFLVPVPTVQQRIVRAKQALGDAGVPFEVPARDEFGDRLGTVLGVLYLIFTEGHTATTGEDWMRPELSLEALRLARVLVALVPREAEAHGLVALMELTAARFPARVDSSGSPVLLADQDRCRWDRSAIARGRAALGRARALATGAGRGVGSYALQAAIAEQHAVAASVEETDWRAIVATYDALAALAPSPVVELNRAVAVSMASGEGFGPEAALDLVDALAGDKRLALSHLVPSARGELLARLGRDAEARAEFERAAALAQNARERAVLLAKAAARR
ncbi:sigma-70 family RNA polymerase sigma factor [Agromyces protaetiae]|uniref:RNA polymerase sigma factor n=1 Tax=Agromyces protaetiae TaxID=2509455 RepID=A0A4P6FDY6_9MICO|nr:sigma-70 family RNA polymerase sigma factor [Agromyces protaetiae]QAY73213.1 sigma-70 family RNA polymerase sigma factor [Agromyces protaetiae]